ncbi:MAG: ABC transporter substrate-binding protein [Treponema sp.]|jgi:NitT/TauT family transport system substrate-binding protein|nr:ABC transporter substrate-binding protein [Treponema sp.]
MKRNVFLFWAVVCAGAIILPRGVYARGQAPAGSSEAAGIPAANEDENYVVKIGRGVTAGLCGAPYFIAETLGYYEEEGLKWEAVFQSTGESQMNLTTGKTDVGSGLLATTIQPLANGFDIKIPLGIHTGCQKVLVKKNSGINRAADLKGKKIGTSGMAASSTVITQRTLANLGIGVAPPNLEVDFVIFQASDLPLAISTGQVDAIALGDPTAYLAELEHDLKVIINQATDDYLKDEFCCMVQLRTGFYLEHPKAAAKFVRAIQRAAAFVQENPEKTAELLAEAKHVAGDPKVNAEILKTYNYKASVSEARKAISRNVNDLKRIGIIKDDIDGDELTNRVFVALDGVPDNLYGNPPAK